MNLKPFNLERVRAGDKVVNRDGREAKFVWESTTSSFPLLFVIQPNTDNEHPVWVNSSGRYSEGQRNWDIFMAPKVKTYWCNIYRDDDGSLRPGRIYSSEGDVRRDFMDNFEKRISFEIEE